MGEAGNGDGEGHNMDVDVENKRKLGFARHLASCNKKTRDRAVEVLRQWLVSQKQVSEHDLKKIWKGLFYCVWHADKMPVQAHLIDKLASLLLALDLTLSRLYFQFFLLTMRREWSGIDYLRLDKFYLLLRRFLRHIFLVLQTDGWNSQTTKQFMDTLTDRAFLAVDKYPARGTNLHFVDVYLNELRDFLPLGRETLGLVFEPFYAVLARASDKVLVKRVKCNVFDCLLENGRKLIARRCEEGRGADVDAEADDEVEKFGRIALTMGITERLLELATSPCTLQANRKAIYALNEDFGKLDKHLSASGVSILAQRAKRRNISTDKCLEVTPLTGKEITVPDQSQEAEADIDMAEESTVDTGKKIKGKKRKSPKAENVGNITDETSTKKKAKSKASSKHWKKKLHLKGQQDAVDEVSIDHTYERRNSANGNMSPGDTTELDDSLIPNLQKQFAKVAEEQGDDIDPFGSPVTPLAVPVCNSSTGSKKRKRVKNAGHKITKGASLPGDQEKEPSAAVSVHFNGVNPTPKTGEKSAKKVRFSMKSNLIWKPHSPLPPQSVRLPPSATPRGSALKKGVPPGPIRVVKESPSPKRLWQRSMPVRKSRKILKTISPSVKLLQLRRSSIW